MLIALDGGFLYEICLDGASHMPSLLLQDASV